MYACMYVCRFLQSRNPEAFEHSNSRHTFNSESLPILFKIPNPELEIREIPDPENLLGTLYFESWNSACLDFFWLAR